MPTQVAEELISILTAGHNTGAMVAAVMPEGTGKTMVLRAMAEQLNGWYLYCDQDLTPTQFVRELCTVVGLIGNRAWVPPPGPPHRRLNTRRTRMPLALSQPPIDTTGAEVLRVSQGVLHEPLAVCQWVAWNRRATARRISNRDDARRLAGSHLFEHADLHGNAATHPTASRAVHGPGRHAVAKAQNRGRGRPGSL